MSGFGVVEVACVSTRYIYIDSEGASLLLSLLSRLLTRKGFRVEATLGFNGSVEGSKEPGIRVFREEFLLCGVLLGQMSTERFGSKEFRSFFAVDSRSSR